MITYMGKIITENDLQSLQRLGADISRFLYHPEGSAALSQPIITDMFRCVFIRRDLESVQMDNSRDSLLENIQIYQDIASHIAMLNSTICTRECLEKGWYDTSCIPQSAGVRNAQAIRKMLMNVWLLYAEKKEILINLYHAYRYSILRTLDMLILVLGLEIMKFSPFCSTAEQDFCDGMLRTMLKLLRDAQVIAIFKSDAYFDRELEWMDRGSRDHTTRLQILYEYDNGDQYSLRLDLPHKGIPFFHLNSQSKGKVEYFPLDEPGYQALIKETPSYKQFFIDYGNGLYFLRENAKGLVNKPEPSYEKLADALKENEHFPVEHQLEESEILELLTVWCGLLNSAADRLPDSEKIDPVKYYRLSKAYSFIELCCYAKLEGGASIEKKLRQNVLQFLYNSQLFSEEETDAFADIDSMEVLTYAIEKLKE